MKNLKANSNKDFMVTKSFLFLSLLALFLFVPFLQTGQASEVNPMLTNKVTSGAATEDSRSGATQSAVRGVASDANAESRTKVVSIPHRMGAQEDRRN